MEQRFMSPRFLDDYDLDLTVKNKLKTLIESARKREKSLGHVLLYGTSGCDQLSHIIANELGVNIRHTSARGIERPGDLAALLTNLQSRDLMYIEDIHLMDPETEEVLYYAMKDFSLDMMIGKGPTGRSVRLDLSEFTLIASTHSPELLSESFRELFDIQISVNDQRVIQDTFVEKSTFEDLKYKVSLLQYDVETIKEKLEDDRWYSGIDPETNNWIVNLFPILDDFERALKTPTITEEARSFVKGMKIIYRQIEDLLEKEGIREIEAEGKPFDPHIHDAVAEVRDGGYPSNTVVEVVRKGYKHGDFIIRPAMVKVAE